MFMNPSYLNSIKNTDLPFNISKTIYLLLLILCVSLLGNLVNAQTTLSQFDSVTSAKTVSKTSASQSIPTITSLGSASGCIGMDITINGTNLSGAIAENVKIGGTAVSSISSISDTQIVAVIGNGTTGNVTVTNSGGAATSGLWFTVNSPTVAGVLTPENTNVCSGSWYSGHLTLSDYTGSIIRWESSTDNFATAGTPISNTGNTQVIGTHTTDTYYRAVIQSGSCDLLYSNSVKITVSGAMPATTGISLNGGAAYPPTGAGRDYCASTTATFSTAPVANATSYTWVIPEGWSVVSGQGTTTLTAITGNSSQSANVMVYASNIGCGNSAQSYLFLYLGNPPPPPTPTPTVTLTQPTCAVATGTITVNTPVPAAGITYTVVGISPVVAAITNSTGVFSGLAEGDYHVTASKVSGCGPSAPLSVTLAMATNTWDGISWSNGTPTASQALIFNGNYPSETDPDVDISGCSCTVNTGKNVTIKTGRNLIITNKVAVLGTGTLTFENNASLVQINEVKNSGNITYNRTTSAVRMSDYTYWSSPVDSQNLNISPSYALGMFYSYNDFATPEDWKKESLSTIMIVGKGYIIRGPQVVSPMIPPPPPGLNDFNASFTGIPNNGTITIDIGPIGTYNLIGNPYPSAIYADQFLYDNKTVIDGTIYFWTHNTAIQNASLIGNNPDGTPKAGSGVLAYTSDDYASYNLVGGVGTGEGTSAPSGGVKPTGKIAAGQSFFTTSTTVGGSIKFTNLMRVDGFGKPFDNTNFYKTTNSKTKTTATIEKHRVWLNLTNKGGAFKQTLVGYLTGATNTLDKLYDGESFDANEYVDFYSLNQDKNLVIQGRALPFDQNDEVPLGYRSTIDGAFTINIDQTDGVLANQPIFLEDKLINKEVDLKRGSYTFNTTAGTFNERFVLKYSSKTLGVDSPQDKEDGIIALYSNADKTIIIRNNGDATIHSVSLFGMSGQNIAVWDLKNKEQTNIQLPTKEVSSGIYILKMKTTTGESGKKIIVN